MVNNQLKKFLIVLDIIRIHQDMILLDQLMDLQKKFMMN